MNPEGRAGRPTEGNSGRVTIPEDTAELCLWTSMSDGNINWKAGSFKATSEDSGTGNEKSGIFYISHIQYHKRRPDPRNKGKKNNERGDSLLTSEETSPTENQEQEYQTIFKILSF